MTREELIQRLTVGDFSLSFSKLKQFEVSPDQFIRHCLREIKRTKPMRFGSMLHCLVLEPHRFAEFYATMPDGVKLNENPGRVKLFDTMSQLPYWAQLNAEFEAENGRTLETKDFRWALDWSELHSGMEWVNNTDRDKSHRMAEAILSDPRAAEIINTASDLERAIEFDLAGWKWRGKVDIVNGSDIADLKKVKDADPRNRSLRWNLSDDGYFVQQYVYRHALGKPGDNRVICVDENCQVSVLKIGMETMLQAEAEFHKTMTAFEKCRFLGDWGRSFGFWSETGEFEI